MTLSSHLQEAIRSGRVVLVLGAGASLEARNAENKRCPSTNDLSRAIADRFLGSQYSKAGLGTIAQYATSEASLQEVEEFIKQAFTGLKPTAAHKALASFPWKGIVTTNYDNLIEQAYEQAPQRQQTLHTIVDDYDRFDVVDSRALLLLKLHGCILRPTSKDRPLILTVDQYVTHKKCRARLFSKFEEWAYEHPLVFVGHSLEDSDIRELLLKASQISEARPRYFVVAPDVDEIKARFWETRSITLIKGTFNEFMLEVGKLVPKQFRSLLQSSLDLDHPISKNFSIAGATCSSRLYSFLETQAEYVGHLEKSSLIEPSDFYRGANPKWAAVERGLDVPRQLQDAILSDSILGLGESKRMRLIVLKGPAGSGKSVLMQRLAWTATHTWNKLCVFIRDEGRIDNQAVAELAEKCKEQIFLFIDNGADHVRDLENLSRDLGDYAGNVICVVAERINEWNSSSLNVDHLVEEEYVLAYLSNKEIDGLLELLERNSALGSLKGKSLSERRQAFQEYAGRQLLVALHEATYGRPFEDIIEDEFNSIPSAEARDLYLSICVLNRFNAPVRAGAISRMHDLPFDEFKAKFFRPLEHIVFIYEDPETRDHWYKARHPHIADIVFQNIFKSQEERYDKYVNCLQALNPGYSSDRSLIRNLIRARSLLEIFSNHELVRMVYKIALDVTDDDPYVLQQQAIYDMNRPNPSFKNAEALLKKASEKMPADVSIQHSIAELYLRMGEATEDDRMRSQVWRKAETIVQKLKSQRSDSFPFNTQAKIGLARLKRTLEGDQSFGGSVDSLVKDVETCLSEGLQRFPADPHLKQTEASLANLLSDDARVRESLEQAFEKNRRSVHVARRLASIYTANGDPEKGEQTLARGLEAIPNSQPLHLAYARHLLKKGGEFREKALYHLKRSYAPGDSNREAQILHGRELILSGQLVDAEQVFQALSNSASGPGGRNLRLFPLKERVSGYVKRVEAGYALLDWSLVKRPIYSTRSESKAESWENLAQGKQVSFTVAFNSRGPIAMDIETA